MHGASNLKCAFDAAQTSYWLINLQLQLCPDVTNTSSNSVTFFIFFQALLPGNTDTFVQLSTGGVAHNMQPEKICTAARIQIQIRYMAF